MGDPTLAVKPSQATVGREFRDYLAYLGFCYALVNDVEQSEYIRHLVRLID